MYMFVQWHVRGCCVPSPHSLQGYSTPRAYLSTQGVFAQLLTFHFQAWPCCVHHFSSESGVMIFHPLRSPAQDCGGLLEAGVAGEGSLHCDDH